ncbi:MAG: diphosphate--fructose-6-phosphate 1-phosphotransferase, partial [Abditibacteriota bacterium]|nr:diphosphate--fructose-6-phosphate 1-phosphotransferase [Abditibacteriota bacterium]
GIMKANPKSKVYGFLKGPGGAIANNYMQLTAEFVDGYRNTGGFDMIMSGRDKIETPEQLQSCADNFRKLGLSCVIIIGGDDSNTNAAVLAEYMKANNTGISVIGVPKTIDGDMKNDENEASFGFDTACKTYSELIGNIERDASSAVKYWHFIKLMGRAASHVALECALQTQPNICLISEEVKEKKITLSEIVNSITDAIVTRAEAGKNYGVILIPEGLPEFIADIKTTIDEISDILGIDAAALADMDADAKAKHITGKLSAHSAEVFSSLPAADRQVLMTRDSHGNVPLSQVETEKLLISLVSDRIKQLKAEGKADKVKFKALGHFLGYEGRCAAPSNYDADYCYSLGYTAAQMARAGLTGYTVKVANTDQPADKWVAGAVPVTKMLNMEQRKGKPTPVIKKALVELDGAPFRFFAANRDKWAAEDCYVYPGAIQYFGPAEVCDQPTKTLTLEKKA